MTNVPIAPLELVDTACLAEFARSHWRKTTTKSVSNSAAKTDMLNGEFIIDANAMQTSRTIRLRAKCQLSNGSGGALALPRWTLELGGTLLLDTGAPAGLWASGGNGVWKIEADITNLGVANAQNSMLDIRALGTFVAGNGAFATGTGTYLAGAGTGAFLTNALGMGTGHAVDTTNACSLLLTCKLPTANIAVVSALYDASCVVV